ncbi:MAG: acyl-CoA thioesterase [Slackia sp.]
MTYGDTAIVRTRVTKLTPAKTVYSYEVYKEGQVVGVDKPCCTGSSTHCLVSESFKPVNQKRIMPDLYAAYQEALEADE